MSARCAPLRSGRAAPTVALLLALLSGCSCCTAPPAQRFSYVVDEATATRINHGVQGRGDLYGCQQECALRAGYTDAGGIDANLPDAGPSRPTLPVLSCTAGGDGRTWVLVCYYAAPCSV